MKKILIILLCMLPHWIMAQKDRTDSLKSQKGDELVYSNMSFKIVAFCVLGDQKYIVNDKNELIRLDRSNKAEKLAKLNFKEKGKSKTFPIFVPYNDGVYLSNYTNKSDYVIISKDQSHTTNSSQAPDPKKMIHYNKVPVSKDKYLSITHTVNHPTKIDETVILHGANARPDTLYKYINKAPIIRPYTRPTIQAIKYKDKIYVIVSTKMILQIHDLDGRLIQQYRLRKIINSRSFFNPLSIFIDQSNGKVYIKNADDLYHLTKDDRFLKQNIKKRFRIHQIYNNQIYYSEIKDGVNSIYLYDL